MASTVIVYVMFTIGYMGSIVCWNNIYMSRNTVCITAVIHFNGQL